MVMEVVAIKIKVSDSRDHRPEGASESIVSMSTAYTVVLSSSDSKVPSELALQHDLDCYFQLHSSKNGSVVQCLWNK